MLKPEHFDVKTIELSGITVLTRRTVCRGAAGNTSKTRKKLVKRNQTLHKTHSWGYKTIALIKRHQQNTITKKGPLRKDWTGEEPCDSSKVLCKYCKRPSKKC